MDTYPVDKLMVLADGAAATTANGIAQVAAAAQILNLGAPLSRSDLGIIGELGKMKVAVTIDITAIVTANVDDIYRIDIMGSNNANGSAPVCLGGMAVGNGTLAIFPNGTLGAASTGAGSTTSPGRFILFADMVQNDVAYQYLYLFTTVAGTAKSITFSAFASAWPPR